MLGRVRVRAAKWPHGRWFVLGALAVAAFFFVEQALVGSVVYAAFLKAIGAGAAVMVLLGLGQRLWEGERMQGGQLPGGAGAQFEAAEAAGKTRESIERLNQRVTSQSERMIDMQARLESRASDLEAAFKRGFAAPEKERREGRIDDP